MKSALKITACAATIIAFASAALADPQIKLRVIETTDIHSYLTAYDYYQNRPVKDYGFTLAASLVKQLRGQVQNSVTVDNGDLIQGSLIGEYAAANLKPGELHPAYVAMNKLGYDAANIGNHEFNFGLDYLNRVLKGADFPYVNSNVYYANDPDKNYFTPYVIKEKEVVDTEGKKHTLKIGYIGFTPPGIMKWDADKLTGKIIAKDIYESAMKFVPEMKAKGADVIVAIPHSGVGTGSVFKLAENASALVAQVPGVNAVLFGHSHAVFPSKTDKAFDDLVKKGIADMDRGTLNGVPSVMPGHWGSHVGVVDLVLDYKDGKWVVNNKEGKAEAFPVYDFKTKKSLVEEDPEIKQALQQVHDAVIAYTNRRFGTVSEPINGYLSLSQDDEPVKLVNQAQLWYLQNWVEQNPHYKDYKLVSAAAPFKFGHRHDKPDEFIHVPAGPFTLRNVSDVYIYPNTFYVVQATGAELRDWIECSSNMFNTIDVNNPDRQEVFDYTKYRTEYSTG